jgi:hypothetical protein
MIIMDWKNKVAVIAGASTCIGKATPRIIPVDGGYMAQ